MNESRMLTELSVSQLKTVLQLKEEIASLEDQLGSVLAGAVSVASAAPKVRGKRGGRRSLSAEGRARIAAAQRARWQAKNGAPASAPAVKPVTAIKGKRGGARKMSSEARERIAAAQRARWAASRGDKPAAAVMAAVAKPKGKRGGARKMSPEARERIAAAQRARWAAVRKS